MDHEIVALGVVGIRVGRERGARGLVGSVHLVDDDVGAFLEALFEEVLLRGVVVAATTGDQQNFERLGRGGREGETGQRERGDEGEGAKRRGERHDGVGGG